MNRLTKILAVGLVAVATVAVAKEGVQDPTVKARMDLMGTIGMNTKVLGDMASGRTPFDAAAASTAKTALMAASADIVPKFETEADDPVSEGAPDIWMNFEDFTAKANTLSAAATAIDVASLEGIQAGMGAIGGTCRDCHTSYRVKK
jgi:cytochrome c556